MMSIVADYINGCPFVWLTYSEKLLIYFMSHFVLSHRPTKLPASDWFIKKVATIHSLSLFACGHVIGHVKGEMIMNIHNHVTLHAAYGVTND